MSQSRMSGTISYFTVWGLIYGLIFGALLGVSTFPLPILQLCACEGSQFRTIAEAQFFSLGDARIVLVLAAFVGLIAGALLGPLFGGLQGVIIGMIVRVVARKITPETDFNAYGSQLYRYIGYFVGGFYLTIIGIFYMILTGRLIIPGVAFQYQTFRLAGLLLLEIAIGALVMPTLAIRFYPAWIASNQPFNSPSSRMVLIRQSMERNFHILRRSVYSWKVAMAAIIIGYLVVLTWPNVYALPHSPLEWLGIFALMPIMSIIVLWVLGLYIAMANAALLMYAKAAGIEYYAPGMSDSRARVVLTICAFIFTLLAVWWTLWLAPLCAIFAAYQVYHTFDLSEDKAKRKEKDSPDLASQNT